MVEVVEEITELFIHAGIHLDGVNIDGLTAAQLCTSCKYQLIFFQIFVRILPN